MKASPASGGTRRRAPLQWLRTADTVWRGNRGVRDGWPPSLHRLDGLLEGLAQIDSARHFNLTPGYV